MKNKPAVEMQEAEGREKGSGFARGGRLWKASRFTCLGVLNLALLVSAASAQQVKPPANAPTGPLTFDAFRLIHTRNVFDPDRRPVRPVRDATALPVGRADYLALTGTLSDGAKTYAFFSGSRPDFNKVLTVRDKIASATITQITPMNIVVERGGKSTNVAVGQTVPLDDKSVPGPAPANYAEVTSTSIERPANANANTGTGDDNPPPAAPGTGAPAAPVTAAPPAAGSANGPAASREEIMRRMMEKRKQDLK